MSLLQLLEVFVSDEPPPGAGIVITPFLSLRNAGEKSFWGAIDQISKLDLPPAASQYWRTKLLRQRNGYRIRGFGRGVWTKPMRSTIPD